MPLKTLQTSPPFLPVIFLEQSKQNMEGWGAKQPDLFCEIPMSQQSHKGLTPQANFKVSKLPEKETPKMCLIFPWKIALRQLV